MVKSDTSKHCGSVWVGMTEVDYFADLVGYDEDWNPLYAVFKDWCGLISRVDDAVYDTLDDAYWAGHWLTAGMNYD